MRKKNYKGRCTKRTLSKSTEVVRTYEPLQYAYADMLQSDESIREIRCNVLLDGLSEGEYTSDFVCIKTDGDMIVRECVQRKLLMKPMTISSSPNDWSWSDYRCFRKITAKEGDYVNVEHGAIMVPADEVDTDNWQKWDYFHLECM